MLTKMRQNLTATGVILPEIVRLDNLGTSRFCLPELSTLDLIGNCLDWNQLKHIYIFL